MNKVHTEDNSAYDREVGTKGIQISGGQKQRLAIARCVLSDPKIFFFDEATSALDVETEKVVFENLNKISSGKTSISIAHRVSTIVDANKIIVFH
jgi:ABC-type bacteriocin/lantibiotic exporter with double-glycine peptidase domain